MNSRQAIATVAVGCAVLSGAFLVHAIYRVTPAGSSLTAARHWAVARRSPQPHRDMTIPQPTKVTTKAQVGRLGEATKRLQTRADVVRR